MCNLRLAPNVKTRLQAMFRAALSQAWHLSERSRLFARCSILFFQIFKTLIMGEAFSLGW